MQNKVNETLWHVAIEEANQTGFLPTGGDIGILSQACAWDSPTSLPLLQGHHPNEAHLSPSWPSIRFYHNAPALPGRSGRMKSRRASCLPPVPGVVARAYSAYFSSEGNQC
jgi:hypothetical protein